MFFHSHPHARGAVESERLLRMPCNHCNPQSLKLLYYLIDLSRAREGVLTTDLGVPPRNLTVLVVEIFIEYLMAQLAKEYFKEFEENAKM